MKLPKTDPKIAYQNVPRGSERCDVCSMYRRPNQCTLVNGHILAQGWCKRFDRKET